MAHSIIGKSDTIKLSNSRRTDLCLFVEHNSKLDDKALVFGLSIKDEKGELSKEKLPGFSWSEELERNYFYYRSFKQDKGLLKVPSIRCDANSKEMYFKLYEWKKKAHENVQAINLLQVLPNKNSLTLTPIKFTLYSEAIYA